jgi:antitoxin component of MazEF toxin-antitoxin module
MNDKFEELYNELYSPKITPHELLENVKLENYLSVEFNTDSNNNIIATTKCQTSHEEITEFTYVFANDYSLQELTAKSKNSIDVIYNRQKEVAKLYRQLTSVPPFNNAV